jgi:hypothetical protein
MVKLAGRLAKKAMKLFPNDEAQQEAWFLEQFEAQLEDTEENCEFIRTMLAGMLCSATKEACEQFPHCNVNAVARILELMGWGADMIPTAKKALQIFLTSPVFAEDREIRGVNPRPTFN